MSFGTVQAEKMTTESGYSLGAGNASSFKNRIINGAQTIDQRNAGASVTASTGTYTFITDRFKIYSSGATKLSGQRTTTAPTGFTNSLAITSLAATSPGASDEYQLYAPIEGYNIADLGWGTASAKDVTLSFWVRSSLTGTFSGCLYNPGGTPTVSYIYTYTISSANTWEYKTITIPGNTTATWGSTNGDGISIVWDLGSGSNLNGTAGSWATGFDSRTSGSVTLVGTNGATFNITGVQFEVGTVATSFDFRSIGQELALCQRYYFPITLPVDTNICYPAVVYNATTILIQAFPVTLSMRTTPSITATRGTATISFYRYDGTFTITQSLTDFSVSTRSTNNGYWFEIQWTGASSWGGAGNTGAIAWSSGTSSKMALSAEL
jgi:hypothetical protein